MSTAPVARSGSWKWWVCGLLLFASMILYMDRQTLPNVATRITKEFQLNNEQYGVLEMMFGYAFAGGAFVFGIFADNWKVRWLYPAVLILWSTMGFLTGLVRDYEELLWCRTLLGFFEAGHWPCALKTTQRLLARSDRTFGNSVLQSGASFGAILTPLVMTWMLAGRTEAGVWRQPFLVVGSVGVVWVVAWFCLLRERDFAAAPVDVEEAKLNPVTTGSDGEESFWRILLGRRFWVLVVIVASINTCWQIIRAWLPKFLQEGRGYTESEALYFNSLYYIATDVGCLGAGALTLWLVKRGRSVHGSRALVFGGCAILTALTCVAAYLPRGWSMLGIFLVIAAASLGLFPCFYSFSQELSTRHQGKVTGILGTVAWVVSSPMQQLFGRVVDRTGSFNLGLALAGLMPLMGFVALWWFWDAPKEKLQKQGGG